MKNKPRQRKARSKSPILSPELCSFDQLAKNLSQVSYSSARIAVFMRTLRRLRRSNKMFIAERGNYLVTNDGRYRELTKEETLRALRLKLKRQ